MRRSLLVTLTAFSVVVILACGSEEPPTTELASPQPPDVVSLLYSEECRPCGAAFAAESLVEREHRDQFQVRLTIKNTGERGRLDFSAISAVAFGLDQAQADSYSSRFQEKRRNGVSGLLEAVEASTFTLSFFLDSAGSPSVGPILEVGETWDGWLVFHGLLPQDPKALLLWIRGIQGDNPSAASQRRSGWVSYTASQPFIVILGR